MRGPHAPVFARFLKSASSPKPAGGQPVQRGAASADDAMRPRLLPALPRRCCWHALPVAIPASPLRLRHLTSAAGGGPSPADEEPPQQRTPAWSPASLLKAAGQYLFSDTLDDRTLVGVDDHGNEYYEVIRTFRADGTKQSLRVVEPATGTAAADYDPTSVPPQWRSWLSYSRKDAPAPDEVYATAVARQQPVVAAAAAAQQQTERTKTEPSQPSIRL